MKSRLPITWCFSVAQSFWNFAQNNNKKWNDWTTMMNVVDRRHFGRFVFKMTDREILHCNSPQITYFPWWRHEMETFSALLAICAGNSPVPGEIPTQRPVARSFDVFFDLRLNKWLSKQSWGWWFETPSRPLWRHRNAKRRHFEQSKYIYHTGIQLGRKQWNMYRSAKWSTRAWNVLLKPSCTE